MNASVSQRDEPEMFLCNQAFLMNSWMQEIILPVFQRLKCAVGSAANASVSGHSATFGMQTRQKGNRIGLCFPTAADLTAYGFVFPEREEPKG